VVYSEVSGIIGFNAKVLLADGTHEFFYPGVTDHVYFEGTRSPPVGTADIAFVSLFARMRFGGPLVKRG